MQLVTREDVLHCAALAALDLDESEIEPLRRDMEQLLSFAGRLEVPELGGAKPDAHIVEPPLRRREDTALPSLSQAEALMNAPGHDRGCFSVPKIL